MPKRKRSEKGKGRQENILDLFNQEVERFKIAKRVYRIRLMRIRVLKGKIDAGAERVDSAVVKVFAELRKPNPNAAVISNNEAIIREFVEDLRKAGRSYAALIKDAFRIGKIIATGPFAEKLRQLRKIVGEKLARYEGVLQQIEGKKGQKGIAD